MHDWVEDVFAVCKTLVKLLLKGSGSPPAPYSETRSVLRGLCYYGQLW